ncbi:MAG: VWA-like domain-containing protein [Patescibacteria group bacterium]|nr:VWA-like domain-containing protein [Patescibacteria group bacterium]
MREKIMTTKVAAKRQIVEDEVARAVTDAKIYLLLKHPYIGAISSRMEIVSTDIFPTAATDGKKIYYNPEFFKDLTKGQIVFVIAHEILHIVYDHVFRRGSRIPSIWNMAIDYIVNYTLVKNEIGTIPENILYNEKYTDEYSSEELYEILLKEKKNNSFQILVPLDTHLDGEGDSPCNSDDNDGQKTNIDISVLGGSLTKEEIDNIRNDIKSIIFGIYSSSKKAGNIPAGIERLIEKFTEPKIDWKEVLLNFVMSNIKTDYNFRKPSNLSWIYNIILPSFSNGEEVSAHIFIDASGSISENQLVDFLSEVKNIMETFDSFNLSVGSFDTKVYNVKNFTIENMHELTEYKVKGGGGTDFVCVFDYLKAKNIEPKTLVIFTDGYPCGSWGDPSYCNDTIFVINNNDKKIKAPFGITVRY